MKELTKKWIEYAERDHEDAKALLGLNRYHGALFFYQQAVEKMIKAHLIENKTEKIPFVHDIRYLLESTSLSLDELKKIDLKELSLVYTRIRYPDMDTKYYSNKDQVVQIIHNFQFLYLWIKNKFNGK